MPIAGTKHQVASLPTATRVPQPIVVLNQNIDDENGVYRIRVGQKVGYLTISTNVFDEDTMCRPYLLIPALPKLPDENWTRIRMSRSPNGFLEMQQVRSHRSNVHEVIHNGTQAISKVAAFEWQIPSLEHETNIYSILDQDHRKYPNEPVLSPQVLGHLTENGRVIGLLLEKLEGVFASVENLAECKKTLLKFHEVGLVHGDINRYNFIVREKQAGEVEVKMVDFEHSEGWDETAANAEIDSLVSELSEETGRGGPSISLPPS